MLSAWLNRFHTQLKRRQKSRKLSDWFFCFVPSSFHHHQICLLKVYNLFFFLPGLWFYWGLLQSFLVATPQTETQLKGPSYPLSLLGLCGKCNTSLLFARSVSLSSALLCSARKSLPIWSFQMDTIRDGGERRELLSVTLPRLCQQKKKKKRNSPLRN